MEDKQERYLISEKTYQEMIDHTRVLALEERGIVQCGIATCRDFFSVYRKNQKKHMLLYTVRGRGWLDSEGTRYELEPGSLIIVPAGIENGFGMEDETWQIAWLFLSEHSDWSNVGDEITYQLTPAPEVMYACIQTLLRSINLPIDYGGAVGAHSVAQLELMLNMPQSESLSRHKLKLRRVFDLVQRQLHKEWSVEQLAALYPCSEAHLFRVTQQQFGRSPMAHLTRMRMEYAARLLRSTEWPIQHIGEIVGYPTSANFSTRFRSWSGMTPREFRRNGRIETDTEL
ncbi:AraC family transcriptional regulator [Vibrio sp. B1FLJ16]|uniref:AraC family transcriptional regulator n=1 Tax=Vibrio sp. B1FLJ16 TaxID=2751178 RepID=UPI0015F38B29|nr:AraC family transcriptional regulator [Vibrio sp. B1FLJ16]CAD7819632.1 AraC-like ligand binding domain [Vibrio sp. B1FLJ16]CAE6939821.1 AraC-like ligand binding domain [Vibrio sp. B1FLJ16]